MASPYKLELARSSTLLRIQDRAVCENDTELHGGGHRTEKMYTGRGDTAHTLLMCGIIGVGTPHNIERETELGGRVGSVGSLLAGNNTTSWLHLASWDLLDSQLS